MRAVSSLPEGYREILCLDLQKDKKLLWLLNGLSLLGALPLFFLGLALVPFDTMLDFSPGMAAYWLRFGVLIVGTLAYIVLHELTHGAVMKYCGATRLRFGFTGPYAYAGSQEDYFDKSAYLATALAPLLLWSLVLLPLCALVPRHWFWVLWLILISHLCGCVGDIYVSLRIAPLPRDILVQDVGVSMRIYSAGQA